MTTTQHGCVVAVTLTRELASGELVTMPLTRERIPGGVFLTSSALLRDKHQTERWRKRCIYHRPTHRSS
jgi:hypothetical protein